MNGGAKAWQELVDRMPLSRMTPDAVQQWLTRYRSEIENPEVLLVAGARELARTTMESEHQAKWQNAGGQGPAPDPSPADRIRAELSASRKREAYKVLVLGLCAGLRRGEIDRLLWSQVNFAASLIDVKVTDCFAPKANSVGEIPIVDEIVKLPKEWKKAATDRFVVEGVDPKLNTDSHHYRAGRAHAELIRWLQGKGITARNPLHALRKEFGSIVCRKAGVYVASTRSLKFGQRAVEAGIVFSEEIVVPANALNFVKAGGHADIVRRVLADQVDLRLVRLVEHFDRMAGKEQLRVLRVDDGCGEEPEDPRQHVWMKVARKLVDNRRSPVAKGG